MNAYAHIFVSWCSVVEIQIVSVNKMLESKIQQTLEKRKKKVMKSRRNLRNRKIRKIVCFVFFIRFFCVKCRTGILRDSPKGVTRGHVIE